MNAHPFSPEDVVAVGRAVGYLGRPVRVCAWLEQESDLLAPAMRCPRRINDNRVVCEKRNDSVHVAAIAGRLVCIDDGGRATALGVRR